jgi:hypothetical protein
MPYLAMTLLNLTGILVSTIWALLFATLDRMCITVKPRRILYTRPEQKDVVKNTTVLYKTLIKLCLFEYGCAFELCPAAVFGGW